MVICHYRIFYFKCIYRIKEEAEIICYDKINLLIPDVRHTTEEL